MSKLDRKTPPKIKGFGRLSIPKPRTITLDNGTPVTILDNGDQEVNRLSAIWDGGIAETPHPTAATLTANLMREGTSSRDGAQIAETLDYNGAWLRCNTHTHHSSLVAHSLNRNTGDIFPLLTDIITNPAFPQKEFDTLREKLTRIAELDEEKVEYHSAIANRQLLFGENHPLAHSDTPAEIREITIDDVKALHRSIYNPGTCGIYLAGRITPAIEDTLNNTFGQIPAAKEAACEKRIIPFKASETHLRVIKRADALQSAVKISIPTIDRSHPDYIALRIAIMALGGYFGSRLMANIREDKGYTYGITASLHGYPEGGIMDISTQCDNRYVEPLIEEAKKEIERMRADDFSDDEINRLKFFAMTQLASTLDSPFTMMDYYENMRLAGTPENYFEAQIDTLNSLTSERIARLANDHLPLDNIYISIAGNL